MTKPVNPNPGYPPSDPKNLVALAKGVKVWMTDAEEIQYGKGASRGKDESWASRADRVEP